MRILICRSTTLSGIATLALLAIPFSGAVAQDEEVLEEIVVTGSAIKRADLTEALPIQVLDAQTIDRAGITNAADLIEAIPAMQGYFHASDSVGGGGGGIRTANLRAIGSQYTLSLLDGRRMAPAYSGSDIDLSNIPLAAVDQVEILTDGASALYGSDAIAGVVNFIMKDSVDGTTFNARTDQTETSGGEQWNFDIVTGFGDVNTDGYGLVASYSHQQQEQLKASERDFAKTGFIFFDYGGETMYFQNSSANAVPGNAYIYTAGREIRSFNPDALSTGTCATQTTPDGETCRFDYTSTLEILPETERDTITLNGKFKFTDNLAGFGTVLWSNYKMTARIAPYPTGEIPLWLSSQTEPMSDLVATEVWPYLTPEEQAAVDEITGTWRAVPAGNRTTEYDTDALNIVLGVEGNTSRIDYESAFTHAITEIDQSYPTGWLLLDEFVETASSGAFNIFAQQQDFTEEDQAALAPTVYHGPWDVNTTTMSVFDAKGSMPIFEMGGGEAMLGFGVDYRITNYERTIADANRDELLLFLSKDTAYELERDQYGLFAEMLFPFTESFQATASLRYDDISAVEDKLNGTGDIDAGDDGTTYKISALWNLNDAVAFRASYGTGFKAPSMREIGEPRSEFGVTSGTFVCPFLDPADPLEQYCRRSATGDQYDVFREGSASLEFETSTQYSAGVVLTPMDRLDMTVDYWNIELENLVERLTESQIFNNAELYRDLFTTKTNLATGREFLAIIQAAVNAGTRKQDGIDYQVNWGFDVGAAVDLELNLRGTYIMESESSLTGSSLGRFGNDDDVVFRNVLNLGGTLYHGNFVHTLWANYRSGYDDQEQTVEITGTGVPLGQGPTTDVMLDVDAYTVANYSLRYTMLDDALGITFGISNLLDEQPPLSLRTSGSGHQVGWDPRYVDPYGRTFYLQANYTIKH